MSNNQISVRILNKELKINCPKESESRLVSAAEYLDRKMTECKNNYSFVGSEKIAIITALNIVDEILSLQENRNHSLNNVNEKLLTLSNRLDKILKTPVSKPRIRSYITNTQKSSNLSEKTIDENEILI